MNSNEFDFALNFETDTGFDCEPINEIEEGYEYDYGPLNRF